MTRLWLLLLLLTSSLSAAATSEETTLLDAFQQEYLNSQNIFIKDTHQRLKLETAKKKLNQLKKKISYNSQEEIVQELLDRKKILETNIQLFQNRHDKVYLAITKITAAVQPYNLMSFFANKPLQRANEALSKLIKLKQEYQYAEDFIKRYIAFVRKNKKGIKTYQALYSRLILDKRQLLGYQELIEKQYEHILEQRSQIEKEYYEYKEGELFKHLVSLVVIIALFFLLFVLRKLFSRYIKDEEQLFATNRMIKMVIFITMFIFIFFNYSENILYSLTVFTFVGAAIIIASREFLLNIIARFYISISGFLKVGDRILIPHETKYYYGDVINISFVKITMYEAFDFSSTREAVNAGRVIFIPNSYIFSHAVISYNHQSQKMIYDNLILSFTLESDLTKLQTIVQEVIKQETQSYQEEALRQFHNLKKKYSVKQRVFEPEVKFSVNTTSTAVKMSVWFMTPSNEATEVKNRLLHQLLLRLKEEKSIHFVKKTTRSSGGSSNEEEKEG